MSDIATVVSNRELRCSYIMQAVPVLGMIPSAFLSLYTGVAAVGKAVQAVFASFGNEETGTLNREKVDALWQGAEDYNRLLANNILNICTLGFRNSYLVIHELNNASRNVD